MPPEAPVLQQSDAVGGLLGKPHASVRGDREARQARDGGVERNARDLAIAADAGDAAPDGSVWFVAFRGNGIGRFKDGAFSEVAVGKDNAGLSGLAVAPDGAAWFGMIRGSRLGRLRNGRIESFALPRTGARPYSVAVDPTGNVWYADISGSVGMLPARLAK